MLLFALLVGAFAQNVKVDMYSESLCPGCESYTISEVAPAIQNVGTIMDFMLYAYGNAQEKQSGSQWVYTCQHGTGECAGNMYEACSVEHYPTVVNGTPTWFPFFLCMERSGNAGSASVAQKCAADNKLDWNVISKCAGSNPPQGSSDDGNPLMHNIAVATNSLVPPHQWTPWIVMDGKPFSQAQLSESLTKLVCNEYKGTSKPPACKGFEEELAVDWQK